MGRAGGSAQEEYERRRARDAAHRRSNRGRWIAFSVATPLVVYVAVRLGLPWAVDTFFEQLAERTATDAPAQTIDESTANLIALLVAAGATIRVVQGLWGRRQSTEAWGKGARGEVATGRLLEKLPSGFTVLHDLRMPGSRANIDHVVVGPSGVFTIETKRYTSGVKIRSGRVTVAGRQREGIVDQAAGQAQVVAARVQRMVRPIVVVHGGVEVSWFSTPEVHGVRFCSPRSLTKVIKSGKDRLTPDSVAAALRQLGALRTGGRG